MTAICGNPRCDNPLPVSTQISLTCSNACRMAVSRLKGRAGASIGMLLHLDGSPTPKGVTSAPAARPAGSVCHSEPVSRSTRFVFFGDEAPGIGSGYRNVEFTILGVRVLLRSAAWPELFEDTLSRPEWDAVVAASERRTARNAHSGGAVSSPEAVSLPDREYTVHAVTRAPVAEAA